MIKLVDLTYHVHLKDTGPEQVFEKHPAALKFAAHIDKRIDFCFVKHGDFEEHVVMDGVPYHFFKGGNKFWSVSLKTHSFIRKLKPDIVLVQGFIFPLQVIFLRLFCGNSFKIIIQHHGEQPYKGIKSRLQKMACRLAHAFVFTAKGNAQLWKQSGIIKQDAKIFELQEASTNFEQQDKAFSKNFTGITGTNNFLWVGRLMENKDPLTVLRAFEQYLQVNPATKLYMIYQTEELLKEVEQQLADSTKLADSVILVGAVAHVDLPFWFSAADFYISASYKESCGYALMEAMACGCIPVVTAIPSFEKITGNGAYGFLYPPGDINALVNVLTGLQDVDISKLSVDTMAHFKQNLAFKAIADGLVDICEALMINK